MQATSRPLSIWAIVASLLPSVVTFLVYMPALGNGFVNWDDDPYVYENAELIRGSLDARFFTYAFTSVVNSNWHPLTVISYAMDFQLWGLDPFGYHLTNVVLHALATFFVSILAVRLFKKPLGETGALAGAALAGLLFGLHPLHVESVAWISERKDVLSGIFFTASIFAYIRYAQNGNKRDYALALILFSLAILSKPMAISLPIVLLVLDYYPLERIGKKKGFALIVEKLPFFAISGLCAALTLWAQSKGNAIAPLEVFPFVERVIAAVRGYAFYLYKTLVPLWLSPFYPFPRNVGVISIGFLGPLAVLASITGLVVIFRRRRMLPVVWAIYIITLLPVIGIVQVGSQGAADRYAYIPSIALFMLVGALFGSVYGRALGLRALFVAIAVALSVALGALSVMQIGVWRDPVTLWTHVIRLQGEKAPAFVHYNLGMAYKERDRLDDAITHFTKAIEADPSYFMAHNNRGAAFLVRGDYARAVEDLKKAFELNPENLPASYNLALAYRAIGEEALYEHYYGFAMRLKEAEEAR